MSKKTSTSSHAESGTGNHCTRHIELPDNPTVPAQRPIHVTSAYICSDATQAGQVLGNEVPGFAYQRDGHPNEFILAERCRDLHRADFCAMAPSGMGALSLALLAVLKTGDHVLVSRQLYGKTHSLFSGETARFGIEADLFDATDLSDFEAKIGPKTKLAVLETISNPQMRVADLRSISTLAHQHSVQLLVDNTFASPLVCQPLELGADLVMESLTKIMNGHSDVLLGALCGRAEIKDRVLAAQRTWGISAAPFECWLADRGVGTLELRMQRAAASAEAIAEKLRYIKCVQHVYYCGLPDSPDHELARSQFKSPSDHPYFGHMLSFELADRASVDRFISQSGLPFCPSLGDLSTTLSYPLTTSHRGLSTQQQAEAGITDGFLRISVGIEPLEYLLSCVDRGLVGLDD